MRKALSIYRTRNKVGFKKNKIENSENHCFKIKFHASTGPDTHTELSVALIYVCMCVSTVWRFCGLETFFLLKKPNKINHFGLPENPHPLCCEATLIIYPRVLERHLHLHSPLVRALHLLPSSASRGAARFMYLIHEKQQQFASQSVYIPRININPLDLLAGGRMSFITQAKERERDPEIPAPCSSSTTTLGMGILLSWQNPHLETLNHNTLIATKKQHFTSSICVEGSFVAVL